MEQEQTAAPSTVVAPPETVMPPSPRDNFISMLPEELRGEGVFASFNGVEDLAKSYVNAAKMVGMDKGAIFPIPRDDSKEAWDAVYNKLGRPETADSYNLDQYKDSADPDGLKAWAGKLHEAGLSQKQVDSVLGNFFGEAKAAKEAEAKAKDETFLKWGDQINNEYGLATQRKLDMAIGYVEKTLGEDGLKFVENHPEVFRDPMMVRFLVKTAENTGEGSMLLPGGQRTDGPISPADAQQQLAKLTGDPEFQKAYFSKDHPQHQYYVDMRQKLFDYAHHKREE